MKRKTGLLLLGALSLVVSMSALHGCGTKNDATSPPATTPAKFTIVGSGS